MTHKNFLISALISGSFLISTIALAKPLSLSPECQSRSLNLVRNFARDGLDENAPYLLEVTRVKASKAIVEDSNTQMLSIKVQFDDSYFFHLHVEPYAQDCRVHKIEMTLFK